MYKSTRSFNRLGTIYHRHYSENYGILPDSAKVVIGGKKYDCSWIQVGFQFILD